MQSRRNFIHQVAATAISLQLLPFTSWGKVPIQDGPVLRVAIMGLGGYATRVADAMQQCKRAKLVGAISGTPSKLTAWQAKYGIAEKNCYNYESFKNIKNNPDIDVVYITTPNALHHSQVIAAAAAGKHVICEKPMALNAKEGAEMVAACKKAGVQLLVGYRMHFEPKTLEVVRMRQDGELGKIKFFEGLSGFVIGDPTQWRLNKALAGGGALMDIGIYSINGARYMVGEEPIWVTAQETKNDPVKFKAGVDETIQFQLGFPSGAVASILSTYSVNYLDRFYLVGEKGYANLQPATGYGPIKGYTNKGELTQPHQTHQTVQMDEMAAIILDGKKPIIPVDGEEGLRDLKIIDAIYEAVKTGKKISLT
ncbi:putative dehydrogenase [Chitinophaga skermanii]|uniref:Putative dehydrogenase n=1 Tax=Chitinophaga skermanii TaxID=331697 RepID=A0A327QSA5_9BACT|nr:Gfo/Idh/MocA family oxidoreductase [Chitinophaga skermanii]RAJ06524.1 putative dehydrogenase [Chitinophaga skermanii]